MICFSTPLSSRLTFSHPTIDLIVVETILSPSFIFWYVYVPLNALKHIYKLLFKL